MSFSNLFLEKAYEVQISSMLEAAELLKGCPGKRSNQDKLFDAKHELLQARILSWLASIGELVKEQVYKLAQIAANNPHSYPECGQDAGLFARTEIESFLATSLGQGISHHPARSPTEMSTVEHWSRWVCEGSSRGVLSDSEVVEPWAAPAWYERGFYQKAWITAGRPARLSVEKTGRAVRGYQALFARRLQHNLNQAEDRARVELAVIGSVKPVTKSPRLELPTDIVKHPRAQFVDPIRAEKGWSVLEWASEANVDFHTAADYLKGKTRPNPSTRKKLAKSLGVDVSELPV